MNVVAHFKSRFMALRVVPEALVAEYEGSEGLEGLEAPHPGDFGPEIIIQTAHMVPILPI